jgi:hypothetical protein
MLVHQVTAAEPSEAASNMLKRHAGYSSDCPEARSVLGMSAG